MAENWFLLLWGLFILLVTATAQTQGVSCPQCPQHSSCINGISCICQDGYASESGNIFFTDPREICKDINECDDNPAICKGKSCINYDGSYQCSCYSTYSGIHAFLSFFRACPDLLSSGDNNQIFENILNIFNTPFGGNKSAIARSVTNLLQRMEIMILESAFKPQNRIQDRYLVTDTQVVPNNNCSERNKIFTLKAGEDAMNIPCNEVIRGSTKGQSAVAFLSYTMLGNIINGSFFEEERHLQKASNISLNSRVVSGTTGQRQNSTLTSSVILTFKHLQESYNQGYKFLCVYWKSTTEGANWSTEGCSLLKTNATHTSCNCGHLSTFAVLMALTDQVEDGVLTAITYVGLGLSLLCLFLAALTFFLCRAIQGTSTSLHLQLSLCLFLADLLFLTGIHQTANKILCSIIAGTLHYLYLAAFTWMFLEGLYLFLTVRNLKVANYTSARHFKKRFMYPFGYGIPAGIVAISTGIDPHGYGTIKYCWLNLQRGFIWSFVGPVMVIILFNLIFYSITLWILRDTLSSLNKDVSTIQNTRILTFKALAQFLILGCSWSLSFFLTKSITEPAQSIIAYTFTITNSLQGIYIFLVHCILNSQVQEEYRKLFKGIQKISETDSSDMLSGRTTHSKVIVELEKSPKFVGKGKNTLT
ncbi:putative adhesion G protein-coupled receptor E4P [Sarcophilus harrisii]|uniref:putative adhesion G protein-coupled receptor E4P n=1 Tax=Sarcophilus harrisii TaxID=9305 RepID=UPI001301F099|nr:putative adhesion G protein-coupled receptor E4P [Sarcophilus harrisii]